MNNTSYESPYLSLSCDEYVTKIRVEYRKQLSVIIENIVMQGSVSQIFDIRFSHNFVLKNG